MLSRCTVLTLKSSGLELDFAIRAKEIARAEKLDGGDLSAYIARSKASDCNFRELLNAVESGELLTT